MGQYWERREHKDDGTVMTVTVKTIGDGSAERTAPNHTSQGAVTSRYGGYSGPGSVGSLQCIVKGASGRFLREMTGD